MHTFSVGLFLRVRLRFYWKPLFNKRKQLLFICSPERKNGVNFPVETLTKYKTIAVIATKKSLVGLGMMLIIIA